jgi:hypothetical protein
MESIVVSISRFRPPDGVPVPVAVPAAIPAAPAT